MFISISHRYMPSPTTNIRTYLINYVNTVYFSQKFFKYIHKNFLIILQEDVSSNRYLTHLENSYIGTLESAQLEVYEGEVNRYQISYFQIKLNESDLII